MSTTAESVEAVVEKLVSSSGSDPSKINIPKSTDHVLNSRKQKLNCYIQYPAVSQKCKAVIVYIHGYASHTNRPFHGHFADYANKNDCAFAAVDFHGHGYSEGTRCFVNDAGDLQDDVLSLLGKYIYTPDSRAVKEELRFFLVGHSMGGATVCKLGLLFQQQQRKANGGVSVSDSAELALLAGSFGGCIMLAPAIATHSPPPPFVLFLLHNIAAPLFPLAKMPAKDDTPPPYWSPAYKEYIDKDKYRADSNLHGLSYGDPMRLKTASVLMNLMSEVRERIAEINFPFLVFQDPKDDVTDATGVKELMEKSSTSEADKTHHELKDGYHDVLSSSFSTIVPVMIQWVEKRVQLYKDEVVPKEE